MNDLTQEIINEVVTTANEAITFFNKRTSIGFLIYAEDTLTNLVPFAEIAAKNSDEAVAVLKAIKSEIHNIQTGEKVNLINVAKAA